MDYEIAPRHVMQQPILSIRDRRRPSELPPFLGQSFDQLYSQLRLLGVRPAGPPMAIYHEFGPRAIDAEVCVPTVETIKASGRIQSRVLPAMTVASTLHVGRYEDLESAYGALMNWVQRSGFEPDGPITEHYLNGPADVTDPSEYRTEVQIPIVATVAPVAV